MSRPLEFLGDDPAAVVDLDAVDEFDVGGAAPGRHQAIGLGAAVLVGEDHRVAQLPSARRRDVLVPHQQRQIGELADGIRSRVDDRRHRQRRVVRALSRVVDVVVRDVDRRRSRAWRRQRGIAIDRQLVKALRQVAERNPIVGHRFTANQLQVLRVLAVDRDRQCHRLTSCLTPVASGAAGAHRGDGFALVGEHERATVVILRGKGRQPTEQRDEQRRLNCRCHDITGARSRPSARGLPPAWARR